MFVLQTACTVQRVFASLTTGNHYQADRKRNWDWITVCNNNFPRHALQHHPVQRCLIQCLCLTRWMELLYIYFFFGSQILIFSSCAYTRSHITRYNGEVLCSNFNYMASIKFLTWNVWGLREKIKRSAALAFLKKQRADVVVLVETHRGETSDGPTPPLGRVGISLHPRTPC